MRVATAAVLAAAAPQRAQPSTSRNQRSGAARHWQSWQPMTGPQYESPHPCGRTSSAKLGREVHCQPTFASQVGSVAVAGDPTTFRHEWPRPNQTSARLMGTMTPKQPGICLSIDTSCDGSLADADTIRYHGPIEQRRGWSGRTAENWGGLTDQTQREGTSRPRRANRIGAVM
ncbi:hypothetical protein GGI35DRAFT_274343 [Trichoderma velutinum]